MGTIRGARHLTSAERAHLERCAWVEGVARSTRARLTGDWQLPDDIEEAGLARATEHDDTLAHGVDDRAMALAAR